MKLNLVIGLEMHCEMKSISKVFSPSFNNYTKLANINVCEIDLGMPGVLPTLNLECVKKAIKAALILNCKLPDEFIFDRKNYYYPDLPKGYQITQNTKPIGTNGNILIECNNKTINVTIQDIHLEEDSAALDHLDKISLINYNRAGVPLLECVTDPCMHSADEAIAFIDTMCNIYRYADISDADTRKGQIRCDVNISLANENGEYVTPKIEIKNVNSLSNVRAVINYEEERLRNAVINNEYLEQETRRFDEASGKTIHMRSKVDALDYKYFIEPNIPPFIIDEKFVKEIESTIPIFANERKNKYINEYKLDEKVAKTLVKDINIANYFEECVLVGIDPKISANWINGSITSYLYTEDINIKDFYLKPIYLKEIIDAIDNGTISTKQAKEIFINSINDNKEPKNYISKDNSQISDENYLKDLVNKILEKYPEQIKDYHNGKTNMFDFFVGQIMKETKGKANPNITKELITKYLNSAK